MEEAKTYSIRLDREGGLQPNDIPAWKLGELLSVLSKLFSAKGNDFCLTGLENNCVRLDFSVTSPTVMTSIISFSAFLAGHASEENNQFKKKYLRI